MQARQQAVPDLDADTKIEPPFPLSRKRRFEWLVESLSSSIKNLFECMMMDPPEEGISHVKHITQISVNLLHLLHECRVDEAKDLVVQLAREQVEENFYFKY